MFLKFRCLNLHTAIVQSLEQHLKWSINLNFGEGLEHGNEVLMIIFKQNNKKTINKKFDMEFFFLNLIGNGSCHIDRTHNSLYGIFI